MHLLRVLSYEIPETENSEVAERDHKHKSKEYDHLNVFERIPEGEVCDWPCNVFLLEVRQIEQVRLLMTSTEQEPSVVAGIEEYNQPRHKWTT